jgi:hypothetical protein
VNPSLVVSVVTVLLILTSAAKAETTDRPNHRPLPLSIEEVGLYVRKGTDLGLDEYIVDVPLKINGHVLTEVRLSLFESGSLVLDTYLRQYSYESTPDRVTVAALVADSVKSDARLTFDYQTPSLCPEIRRLEFDLSEAVDR